jgi:hypothetical protein
MTIQYTWNGSSWYTFSDGSGTYSRYYQSYLGDTTWKNVSQTVTSNGTSFGMRFYFRSDSIWDWYDGPCVDEILVD